MNLNLYSIRAKGFGLFLLSAFLWLACSTEDDDMRAPEPETPESPVNPEEPDTPGKPDTPEEPDTPEPEKLPINITTVLAAIETRVTDNAFDYGDRIGLYVANRDAAGNPATLAASGNHVDNMRFIYSGRWVPDTPLYWKDNTTHADFYLYYPYTESVTDVNAMPFRVFADQHTSSNYKANDLLIGSTLDVIPSEDAVGIDVKHVMSQVQVAIEPGFGFTAQGLAASQVSVSVDRVKTECTVDLTTATVTPTGEAVSSVTPLKDGDIYKALIVPQTVAEGRLITVTVNGNPYHFNKTFTFESGKLHKFTVTLSRMNDGMNVGIGSWEDDGTDNGGEAEYLYNHN